MAEAITGNEDPDAALTRIADSPNGQRWMDAFEEAKEPSLWFSTGPGYCHQHRSWIDDLTVPFSAMQGLHREAPGTESTSTARWMRILSERERIVGEYRELLPTDEDREAFDQVLGLARQVYPETENHNFYVEHWHHSIFWNKVRDVGAVFEAYGFLAETPRTSSICIGMRSAKRCTTC